MLLPQSAIELLYKPHLRGDHDMKAPARFALERLNPCYGPFFLSSGRFNDNPRKSFARELFFVCLRIQGCVGVFQAPENPARSVHDASSLVHFLGHEDLIEGM